MMHAIVNIKGEMLLPIYVLLGLLLMAILVLGRLALIKFLNKHQAINCAEAIADFKQMVRMNMYGALVLMLATVPWLVFSVLLVKKLGFVGLAVGLVLSVATTLLSLNVRKHELFSKNIPCDPAFKAEYEHVKAVWQKKALPDF